MNVAAKRFPDLQSPPDNDIYALANAASGPQSGPTEVLDLKPGELVEVRGAAEIILDADGKLDGLPFMSEMQKYCGGVFAWRDGPTAVAPAGSRGE